MIKVKQLLGMAYAVGCITSRSRNDHTENQTKLRFVVSKVLNAMFLFRLGVSPQRRKIKTLLCLP
jgi:hypothetical protein